MSEGLAPMNVGEMHLDQREADREEGIHDGDRGVRIGARIDYDAVVAAARALDPSDQLALAVGLAALGGKAPALGMAAAALLDIGEGLSPVDIGLAASEHVQIGAVEAKKDRKSTRLNSSP